MNTLQRRLLSLLLALLVGICFMPAAAIAANGPNTSNEDSGNAPHAYICIGAAGSESEEGVTLYSSDSDAPTGSVTGTSYEPSSNTLTLTDFDGADRYIETNMMGDDFKIELSGNNSLGYIHVWGDKYGGSLKISGTGSLTVNAEEALEGGIMLYAENSYSRLTVDSGVTLAVQECTNGPAVCVRSTTAASGGISIASLPDSTQVKSVQNPKTVAAASEGGAYAEEYPLYTKDEQIYGIRYEKHTNSSEETGTVIIEGYVIYTIAGDDTSGYTASVYGDTDVNPSASFPDGYSAIPGSTYDWFIAGVGDEALTSINIQPGGQPVLTPPAITTSSLPLGIVNTSYSTNLQASSGVEGTLTWSMTSGSLPNGLELASDGSITGTPVSSGDFNFTARVDEAGGSFASCGFTISVSERMEIGNISYGAGTYYPGDKLSVTVPTNTITGDRDTLSLTMAYLNSASQPKNAVFSMTPGSGGFYTYAEIPQDAVSISDLSVSGTIRGQNAAGSTSVSGITFGGTLVINLTEGSETDVTVKHGSDIYAAYPDMKSGTCIKLPAGEYTLSFSENVEMRGSVTSAENQTVTVASGGQQTVTVALSGTSVTVVSPKVKFEGDSETAAYERYTLNWYRVNGDNKTLISNNESYYLLHGEHDIYVQAVPYGSESTYFGESELVNVSDSTININIPRKGSITVFGAVSCSSPEGGAAVQGKGRITVSRPGLNGITHESCEWDDGNGNYSVGDVTSGSVITFCPNGSFGCDPVSYTVTSADINAGAGSLTKNLTAELSKGIINLSSVNLQYAGGKTNSGERLIYMSSVTVKKADGTVLPYTFTGNNSLYITDTSGLSAGNTVTIYAEYGGSKEFPAGTGSVDVTLTGDRLMASGAALNITMRGCASISGDNPSRATAALLLYDSYGNLLSSKRNGATVYNTVFSWMTPYLQDGTYSVYAVQRDYLETLEPSTYSYNPAAFAAGTYVKKSFTISGGESVQVAMGIPGSVMTYGPINYDASSLEMSQSYPDTVTIDLNAVLRSDAAIDMSRGITLFIITNQEDSNWESGAVNTRAFSINGKAVDISRFNGSGRVEGDGKLTVTLSSQDLENYGGFPLAISAVINRFVYDSMEAEAYIKYYDNAGALRYSMVGNFSRSTPSITLEAPITIASNFFCVYGNTKANEDVTVYVDGARAAKVKADKFGYYTANIVLNNLAEYDSAVITATAGTSVSQSRSVLYAPNAASIKKIDIFWKSHNYDENYQSMPVWYKGEACSMYKTYYRGATDAESDEKIYWEIEFVNPDKVEGTVIVNVPRNGETVELEAIRDEATNKFKTVPYFFYGSAPSGMYVTYVSDLTYGVERSDAWTSSDEIQFEEGMSELNASGIISGMTGSSDDFRFSISNGVGSTVSAHMTNTSAAIEAGELEELNALADNDAAEHLWSGNTIYFGAGYLAACNGYWGTDQISKFTSTEGAIFYKRELYTMNRHTVITYDVGNGTKATSVLTLGAGENEGTQPPVRSEYNENLQEYYRTSDVQEVWMAFYSRLGAALEAADNGSGASGRADIIRALKYMKPAGPGEKTTPAKSTDKSPMAEWKEGAPVTMGEARELKNFIEDNGYLIDLWKLHGGYSTGDENPYQVVGKVNGGYAGAGVKGLSDMTSAITGSARSVTTQVIMAVGKDGANYLHGKVFDRKAEKMAFLLYKIAMKEHKDKGLKINWSRFPEELIPYDAPICTQHTPKYPQGRYDPAGYIYEAVPSNRVEGATVNLYTYYDGPIFADASAMGIEPNPQVTGADGRYQWFVPEGYWQVRASKAGYADISTGDSQSYGIGATNSLTIGGGTVDTADYWMPVLPVQLDVNIPIVSYESPTLSEVRAAEDGVYVTFSKYMEEDLAADFFKVNGIDCAVVTALDREAATTGGSIYARTFLAEYPAGLSPSNGESLNIYVDKAVKSYAGTAMSENYSGTATVAGLESCATPVADVSAGQVAANTVIRLSCDTTGAAIYYTVDGSAPTKTSIHYSGAIVIDRTMTVKAVAVKAAMEDSSVLTKTYTVQGTTPVSPSSPGREKTEAAEIPVVPEVSSAWSNTFNDVSEKAWYYGDVEYVCSKGLFEGISEEKFGPQMTMNRAMLVTVLYRLDGTPPVTTGSSFGDVGEGKYYSDAVIWASENNIVEGLGNDLFGPSEDITRQQMATILFRYADYKKLDLSDLSALEGFSDGGKVSGYAAKPVSWAVAAELIKGNGGGLLDPRGNATRAQVAAIFHRFDILSLNR